MAFISSNRAAVVAGCAALGRGLSLKNRGRYRSLGDDAADLIAEGEFDRTALDQKEPGGSPLKPLSPRYLADKVRRGYPRTILVRTKAMLALAELRGEVSVTADEMVMTFGTSEETRQKAEWAHEGGRHRPARPFVGLDERIEADLDRLAEEGLDRQAEDMGCE